MANSKEKRSGCSHLNQGLPAFYSGKKSPHVEITKVIFFMYLILIFPVFCILNKLHLARSVGSIFSEPTQFSPEDNCSWNGWFSNMWVLCHFFLNANMNISLKLVTIKLAKMTATWVDMWKTKTLSTNVNHLLCFLWIIHLSWNK